MGKVRKPTQLLRRVFKQELAVVLGPEEGIGNVEAYRRVQIFIPESPQIFLSIDHSTPLEAGPNRTYNMPPVSPNMTLDFTLQPEQVIYGAVGVGQALIGMLVEYKED